MHFPLLHVAIAALIPVVAWGQQIKLSTGATITGTLATNAAGKQVQMFRGIPYAEPPVGALRWKLAVPVSSPFTHDVNATEFGDACLSSSATMDGLPVVASRSENCLFVNVYTPAGAKPTSNFPVMMWTHGGGFIGGSSNVFDGSNLVGAADNEMVYVSFNYRLGVMGFLSHEQLSKEGVSGNLGLRDQEVAYDWVKQNIRSFGGNPSDVTAFGESAGAMSIALQMLARDGNQKHFQKAITESGSFVPLTNAQSTAKSANLAVTLAQNVGCSVNDNLMSCLRAVNASKIMEVGGPLAWGVTVDGVFLRDAPLRLVQRGQFSRIPSIMGTNTDEGWLFSFAVVNEEDFAPFISSSVQELTANELKQVEALYPVAAFSSPHMRAAEAFSDMLFVCPSEKMSSALASTGVPTYHYRFAQQVEGFGPPLAVHTAEIPYVYNQVGGYNPADAALMNTVQRYWVNFAKTGSPNGYWSPVTQSSSSPLPVWPRYDPFFKQNFVIQTNVTVETTGAYMPKHTERCAFWSVVTTRIANIK